MSTEQMKNAAATRPYTTFFICSVRHREGRAHTCALNDAVRAFADFDPSAAGMLKVPIEL
jgi:hypothetical protein